MRTRLTALASIGARGEGGITRLAYSPAERDAHDLFARWAAADGYSSNVDGAGNSIAVVRPGEPYFLLGSHLDTVRNGGAYDGAAGVVAALESADRVAHEVSRGVRVVAFAGEEGARFGRPNIGSALATGVIEPARCATLRDTDGTSIAQAAAEVGLDVTTIEPWINGKVACFVEVHIEQGRQLESGAARIGLVDAVAGSTRFRIDVTGRADHSGATPMPMRADSLAAASEIVLAAEKIGRQHRLVTVTVGRIEVWPNSLTTVPGTTSLWVDVRAVDGDLQRSVSQLVLDRAEAVAEIRGVQVTHQIISEQPPVVLDTWPRVLAGQECAVRGVPYRVLASGAGHDAAVVATCAPAAIVFIPCVDGISHAPSEAADVDDLVVAEELTAAVLRRADEILG